MLAPPLDDDTTIVTCPFSLIITKHTASQALKSLLGPNAHALDTWSPRQLICSYLTFHHLCNDVVLRHVPYIPSLPSAVTLLTPLHFTTTEREILRGTNLYGATLDRERDWRAEWAQCLSLVHGINRVHPLSTRSLVHACDQGHVRDRLDPSLVPCVSVLHSLP